ncbi:flagellar hook assembly protein FlgD [Granulicella arctica]|uniref:flagellar hook assembly protein FlgD n=1 Tax=Granulicella arctica TaxID=940613 RepID=UPI0021DFD1E7|nr:flagellar hook capping FlgD N-terminal domain-containing protein [Granulicella arctica]
MSGLQFNSLTSAGTAAASVASSLIPKKHMSASPAQAMAVGDKAAAAPANDASAGDITSSDFLTLLVSELKNQDPTQPTDPNAYITQLVGVNSLQQLISINSGLTSIETPPAS